jgi:hypothetical protein
MSSLFCVPLENYFQLNGILENGWQDKRPEKRDEQKFDGNLHTNGKRR